MSFNCFEQAHDLSDYLSSHDKLRLIEELVQQLLRELPAPEKKPSPSLWGAWPTLARRLPREISTR
ncbi:MAG: hypothetical protein JO329_20050, partial [Planctomycetaceae bacterium]|nr:hypothetical protein [Planctomycetaceae bacterium]